MKRFRPKLKEAALGDWRHAIFKRVVSPTGPEPRSSCIKNKSNDVHQATTFQQSAREIDFTTSLLETTIKSRREIRELWRNAIRQQILLNRMDKQNCILKAQQNEVLGKRVKLSYTTIGVCDDEASDTWDSIMSKAQQKPGTICDVQLLNSAILRGIPKHKRGQVWQFFIQQRRNSECSNIKYSLQHNVPYDQLRRQLTTNQHSILIDLGRTFPSHPFFCDPLGPGQRALFNLLKAYSILDPDVGYCQGLNFVAGVLLMHLEEEEAFDVLKYFMFDLGAREHYKSDMDGLQVKLYQLTRMMHDQDPEVQQLLYGQDVLPSLYAAPWILTMFAAQFSVGFSVRVLDVVLLHGIDMITKFAVATIVDHKSDLIKCTGLEQVMECFRHQVTKLRSDDVNRYLRKVLEKDSDEQLLTYAVEYSVMQDESFVELLSDGPSSLSSTKGNGLADTSNDAATTASCEDCLKLQQDIFTLLQYIEECKGTHKFDDKELLCCPPEISALLSKYSHYKTKAEGAKLENNVDQMKLNTFETCNNIPEQNFSSGSESEEIIGASPGIFHIHSLSVKSSTSEDHASVGILQNNNVTLDESTYDINLARNYLIY